MTTLTHVVLDAPDPAAATAFYAAAFGPQDRIRVRAADTPISGFRGFTLNLVVPGPGTVDARLGSARAAGATVLKSATKSIWGYGGSVQAPDGAIWKIATAGKKDPSPETRQIEDVALLLGVEDVVASRRFYTARGLRVSRSFGRTYAEFTAPKSAITLALYRRRALANDAGVPADAAERHGIVLASDDGIFVDPDGFAWGPVPVDAPVQASAPASSAGGAGRGEPLDNASPSE